MAEPVEFVAKSRFSFKALIGILVFLAVLEILQWRFSPSAMLGQNAGNVLLVVISVSYFYYRYNLLKVVITPKQVSFGYRETKMQVMKREDYRFECDEASSARYIGVVANNGERSKIPLQGFDKAQKEQIISILVQSRSLKA